MRLMRFLNALDLPEFLDGSRWIVFPQRGGLLLEIQAIQATPSGGARWVSGSGNRFECEVQRLREQVAVVDPAIFKSTSDFIRIPWAEW